MSYDFYGCVVMLSVYFGNMQGELYTADGWFDNQLDEQLLLTEFSKKAVRDIDKSEVVSENLIESPVLGAIPPRMLSGGVKAVIVLRYTDRVVNLCAMGDNCIPSLLEILHFKDLTVSACRFVDFYKFGYRGAVRVLNDDSEAENSLELFDKYIEYRK